MDAAMPSDSVDPRQQMRRSQYPARTAIASAMLDAASSSFHQRGSARGV